MFYEYAHDANPPLLVLIGQQDKTTHLRLPVFKVSMDKNLVAT